jgi:hypothetical protein
MNMFKPAKAKTVKEYLAAVPKSGRGVWGTCLPAGRQDSASPEREI